MKSYHEQLEMKKNMAETKLLNNEHADKYMCVYSHL